MPPGASALTASPNTEPTPRYGGYVSDYWGCPECGHLTLRLEDKDGHCDVATCEYDQCGYFDEGVPE